MQSRNQSEQKTPTVEQAPVPAAVWGVLSYVSAPVSYATYLLGMVIPTTVTPSQTVAIPPTLEIKSLPVATPQKIQEPCLVESEILVNKLISHAKEIAEKKLELENALKTLEDPTRYYSFNAIIKYLEDRHIDDTKVVTEITELARHKVLIEKKIAEIRSDQKKYEALALQELRCKEKLYRALDTAGMRLKAFLEDKNSQLEDAEQKLLSTIFANLLNKNEFSIFSRKNIQDILDQYYADIKVQGDIYKYREKFGKFAMAAEKKIRQAEKLVQAALTDDLDTSIGEINKEFQANITKPVVSTLSLHEFFKACVNIEEQARSQREKLSSWRDSFEMDSLFRQQTRLIQSAVKSTRDIDSARDKFTEACNDDYHEIEEKLEKFEEDVANKCDKLSAALDRLKLKIALRSATVEEKEAAFKEFQNAFQQANTIYRQEIHDEFRSRIVRLRAQYDSEEAWIKSMIDDAAGRLTKAKNRLFILIKQVNNQLSSESNQPRYDSARLSILMHERKCLEDKLEAAIRKTLDDEKLQFWNKQLRYGGGEEVKLADQKTVKVPERIAQLRDLAKFQGEQYLTNVKKYAKEAKDGGIKRLFFFTVRDLETTHPFFQAHAMLQFVDCSKKMNLAEASASVRKFVDSVKNFIGFMERHEKLKKGLVLDLSEVNTTLATLDATLITIEKDFEALQRVSARRAVR